MSRYRLFVYGSTILIALVVILGRVPHKAGPAKLDYLRTSETVAVFELNNRTTHTIEILGERGSFTGVDVHRAEYSLTCKIASKTQTEGAGFADPPSFAKIASGERVRINVHTALIYQSKGGRCQLELPLVSGPHSVESDEFVP